MRVSPPGELRYPKLLCLRRLFSKGVDRWSSQHPPKTESVDRQSKRQAAGHGQQLLHTSWQPPRFDRVMA
eukprot:3739852-Amphidinium_carterae.1